MADQTVVAGALSLRNLMTEVYASTEADFEPVEWSSLGDGADPRDYARLAAIVDQALTRPGAQHRC